MDHELTLQQAREILRLRARHPGAEMLAHQRPWGIIVEARHRGRTLELKRFDWAGDAVPDRRVDLAA